MDFDFKRLTLLDTAVTDKAIKQLLELQPKMKIDSDVRPAEEKTSEEKAPEGEPETAADSAESIFCLATKFVFVFQDRISRNDFRSRNQRRAI